MKSSTSLFRTLLVMASLLLALVCIGTPALADGERLVVHVEEPFEVDGTVYPAGVLSVRVLRHYTPTSTLNEIWVGDVRLGMLITRTSDVRPPVASDAAVFERGTDGRLILVGYTMRGSSSSQVFDRLTTAEARASRENRASTAPVLYAISAL